MRKATIGLMLVIVAVLLAACGGLAGEPEIVGQIPESQQQASSQSQAVNVTPPDIEPNLLLGERIFAENCVRCHGTSGAGDGEFAQSGQVTGLPDFTDPAQHEGKTAADYYSQVTLGNLEKLMPPFADALSDEERWAVANYVLTLADGSTTTVTSGHSGLDTTAASEDTTTTDTSTDGTTTEATTTEETPATGVITGTVTIATEGATLPSDLTATLYIFDMDMNEQSTEIAVNPDGTYQFNNVAIDDQHGYYVSVGYNDGFFNSDFLRGDPETNAMTLDVTLYDVTDDSTALELTSVLTQIDLLPDNTLRIWQMYTWVNNSDKLYSTGSSTGHQLSVRVPVPNGATLSDENDMSRYMYDSDGGYVYDTYPLLPGEEHSFYLQYTEPFSGKLELNQHFDYSLTGDYQVFADQSKFDLQADGWTESQTQEFHDVVYSSLSTTGDSGSLAITINSKGFTFGFDKQSMGMVLTVIGIIFIAVAIFLFVKGPKVFSSPVDSEAQIQALMKEIAELDDLYQSKEISEDDYNKQRAALKVQLTKLMKTDS